jgi:hypothetical protein
MLRVLPLILLAGCRWLAPYEAPGQGGQADARDPNIDARADADAPADLSRVDTSADLSNVIFISEGWLPAGNTSIAEADELCAAEAEKAGLAGRFVAWLSDSTQTAAQRVGDARGFMRRDGRPVTNDLTDGTFFFYPPTLTADGLPPDPRPRYVLTGTTREGVTGGNCDDFQNPDGSLTIGIFGEIAYDFTDNTISTVQCNELLPVYCVGVEHAGQVEPRRETGRLAFVSSPMSVIDVIEADSICANDAAGANLDGEFKALVAYPPQAATSGLDLTGEGWVNRSGLRIFLDPRDIESTIPLTGIAADASGEPVRAVIWTGAASPTATSSSQNCSDWTSSAGTTRVGMSTGTDRFFGDTITACTGPYSVYCFQQ